MPNTPPQTPKRQRELRISSEQAYQLAELRIAKAAAKGATKLDLSIPELDRIPPLDTVSNLRSLILNGTEVSDLTPLVRRAALQSLYLSETPVSDLTPLTTLTALRWLGLGRTQVSDLAPLATLTALQSLILLGTQVSDLTPLATLTALRSLHLDGTPVSNLTPLAKLTALLSLNLDRTRVSDLTPLATLTGLMDGAIRNSIAAGLSVVGIRHLPEPIKRLNRFFQPKRTVKIINYLRVQQGLPPYYPDGYEPDEDDPKLDDPPDIGKALTDEPLGAIAEVAGDHLVLAPSGIQADADAAESAIVRQLHAGLKKRLTALEETALRVQNQPGWRDFATVVKEYRHLIDLSLPDLAARIGEVWEATNALGGFYEQNENAAGTMVEPLEPDGRRQLSLVMTDAGVLIRQFPTAVQLDDAWRQYRALAEPVAPARILIEATVDHNILPKNDGAPVMRALDTPDTGGPSSGKARGRSVATTKNVVLKAARIAAFTGGLVGVGIGGIAVGYCNEIGVEVAQKDILAPKIRDYLIEQEKNILDLFEHDPPGRQAAVRTVLQNAASKASKGKP